MLRHLNQAILSLAPAFDARDHAPASFAELRQCERMVGPRNSAFVAYRGRRNWRIFYGALHMPHQQMMPPLTRSTHANRLPYKVIDARK